jgi:hypothetical protein
VVSQSVYSKVCIKTSIFRAGWVPDIMIHETIDGWFEFCCCRRKNVCGLFTLQYLLLLLVEVHMISVRYISVHIYIYTIYIYTYIYILNITVSCIKIVYLCAGRHTFLLSCRDPDFIWVPCHSDHLFGVLDSNGRRQKGELTATSKHAG